MVGITEKLGVSNKICTTAMYIHDIERVISIVVN